MAISRLLERSNRDCFTPFAMTWFSEHLPFFQKTHLLLSKEQHFFCQLILKYDLFRDIPVAVYTYREVYPKTVGLDSLLPIAKFVHL